LQIGPAAHKLLGDLGTAYIDSQLCEMDRLGLSDAAPEDIPVPSIPKVGEKGGFS
jgi:hypothetical protein